MKKKSVCFESEKKPKKIFLRKKEIKTNQTHSHMQTHTYKYLE